MFDHLDDLFVLSYLWSQISHTSFAEPKIKQEKKLINSCNIMFIAQISV